MQIKWREHRACTYRVSQTLAVACLFAGNLFFCPPSRISASSGEQSFSDPTSHDSASPLLRARSKQEAGEYPAAGAILIEALSKEPRSPALLDALGSVEQDLAQYREAERLYLRALDASTRTAENPERIAVLHNLGTLYLDTGNYAGGQRIRKQLEMLRLDPIANDHPKQAALLLNLLASLNHERNRDDEAERDYAQALQLLRKATPAVSGDIAIVENNLGFLHLEAKRHDSAADFFRKSISHLEPTASPDSAALIPPLVNLARCENSLGHFKEAEIQARRAVQICRKIFGHRHPFTARAMLEQSVALRRLGYKALARELERDAKTTLQSSPEGNWARHSVNFAQLKSSKPDTAREPDK